MLLVETHIIKHSHSLFKECDNICFLSKNLYNVALYAVKQRYELDKTYLNYHAINKIFVETNNPDYRKLPAKVSQQVLMLLNTNYKSYFKALKSYQKTPNIFKACPKPPMFKHKTNGRNIVIWTYQDISRLQFIKTKFLKLHRTEIKFNTLIKDFSTIKQVRIIPLSNKAYKIEVVYFKQEEPLKIDNKSYCGIDIGLNNLFAVTFNKSVNQNVLISGKPLKSINQYYNKQRAKISSELETKNKQKFSNKLNKLTTKRNNKIQDYVHKSTKILVDRLKQNNVTKVVIGKNDNWKDEINIGKKNNQSFVSIPHAKAIAILKYKLEFIGITVILREESYTSKCSLLDLEDVKKHETYQGSRVKRGLFKSKNGYKINADINGGGNILRKEIPNAFANGIEGVVVHPKKLFV